MDPRVKALPQNRGKKAMPDCLCPFGCRSGKEADQRGYCRHLAGWTIDGHRLEIRDWGVNVERCGAIVGEVKDRDVVVPMATDSSRVYRPDGKFPVNCPENLLTPLPPVDARRAGELKRADDNQVLYEMILEQQQLIERIAAELAEAKKASGYGPVSTSSKLEDATPPHAGAA